MAESNQDSDLRVTLVLGGGWLLGGSFHAGVILALQDQLGIDARNAKTVYGTSTGAVTTALIGAGLGPDDLFRREKGLELSPEGTRLLARAHRRRRGNGVDFVSMPNLLPASPRIVARAMSRSSAPPPAPTALVAGLLPRGGLSHRRLRRFVDDLIADRWPDAPEIRFCAVDLHTGRRVVVDRSSPASPGLAVAASCALPGIHAPIKIGGQELLDGALHSVDNLDCAADEDSDLIVVSSPLAANGPIDWTSPLAGMRSSVRSQTESDRERLGDRTVVVIRPSRDDTRTMGSDLNNRRRRAIVAQKAYETACGALSEVAAGDLVARYEINRHRPDTRWVRSIS